MACRRSCSAHEQHQSGCKKNRRHLPRRHRRAARPGSANEGHDGVNEKSDRRRNDQPRTRRGSHETDYQDERYSDDPNRKLRTTPPPALFRWGRRPSSNRGNRWARMPAGAVPPLDPRRVFNARVPARRRETIHAGRPLFSVVIIRGDPPASVPRRLRKPHLPVRGTRLSRWWPFDRLRDRVDAFSRPAQGSAGTPSMSIPSALRRTWSSALAIAPCATTSAPRVEATSSGGSAFM